MPNHRISHTLPSIPHFTIHRKDTRLGINLSTTALRNYANIHILKPHPESYFHSTHPSLQWVAFEVYVLTKTNSSASHPGPGPSWINTSPPSLYLAQELLNYAKVPFYSNLRELASPRSPLRHPREDFREKGGGGVLVAKKMLFINNLIPAPIHSTQKFDYHQRNY